MKNKILFITSLLGLSLFILSEILFQQLFFINLLFTLAAFLFLPLIIDRIWKLKIHFAFIYLSYFGAYIVVAFLSQMDFEIFFLADLVRVMVVLGFLGCLTYLTQIAAEAEFKWNYALVLALGIIAALFINFVVIRQSGSIVALDELQHQSVVNQVYSDLKICLLPSQCNNLFLKDGYTTLYHSVLFFSSPADFSIEERLFSLDVIWLILSVAAIFIFAKKFLSDNLVAEVASILAIFVFINGSYEFVFFIPQTFTFFIFLISYKKAKCTLLEFITFATVMIASHLVMGTFLVFVMAVLELLKHKVITERALTLVAILGLVLTLLMNAYNLTFERIFQASEVEFLGDYTNKEFPLSLVELVNVNPVLVVSITATAMLFLLNKIKLPETGLLIPVTFFMASTYFLAPTYSNKFLVGIGVFMSIIVIDSLFKYLKDINYKTAIIVILFALSIFSFISNYRFYLTFYKSGENSYSVLNGKEAGLIQFLRNTNLECIIVTDPFSQIAVTGLTRFETSQAQYMDPQYRKIINNFLQNPNEARLAPVLEFPGYKDICFVYSYRFEEARIEKIDMWANQLYYYIVDSPKTLTSSLEPIKLLSDEMDLVYKDNYYYIFK